MIIRNKKGADKVLSMYWFAILIIVAGGIFAMVATFYSHPYDIRGLEAGILNKKTVDCISEKGKLNSELFFEGSFDKNFSDRFLEVCNFNFNTDSEEIQYYVEVEFYNLTNKENPMFEFYEGRINWREDCNLKEEEHENLAKCVERRFYSTHNENQYLIKILTIVGKLNENIK